jgi:transposase InsO family protein
MPENAENLVLMRLIDEQFLETPWYGSRQMVRNLRRNGWCVGRHRVNRLMLKMGLAPIYQRPKTNEPHPAAQSLFGAFALSRSCISASAAAPEWRGHGAFAAVIARNAPWTGVLG